MRKYLISVALAAGFCSVLPAASFAKNLQVEIGRDGLRLRETCDSRLRDCRDDHRGRRYCTEDRALNKAERMGVRRARVVSVSRRAIDVRGSDRRGNRVMLRFGRDSDCPVYR